MSTVPERSKASFAYGYREVRVRLPDGRSRWKRVPLTLEDVLHPRFGDVHMLGDPHLTIAPTSGPSSRPGTPTTASVAVFSDCGIYWDIPRLRHHSPDLAVIFGVKRRKDWKTFRVREEGVRPSLIVEVTSPKTRVNDVKTKVEQYARAKVPHYVIADMDEEVDGRRRLTLIAYRLAGDAYERVPLDDRGRAWLEPVGLLLSVKVNPETGGDRVVLIDPETDQEIGDYTAGQPRLRRPRPQPGRGRGPRGGRGPHPRARGRDAATPRPQATLNPAFSRLAPARCTRPGPRRMAGATGGSVGPGPRRGSCAADGRPSAGSPPRPSGRAALSTSKSRRGTIRSSLPWTRRISVGMAGRIGRRSSPVSRAMRWAIGRIGVRACCSR